MTISVDFIDRYHNKLYEKGVLSIFDGGHSGVKSIISNLFKYLGRAQYCLQMGGSMNGIPSTLTFKQ